MQMKQVALITLHNSPNYGSCLQAYATQAVVEGLGCSVEVIDYYRNDAIPSNEVDRALNGQVAKAIPFMRSNVFKRFAALPVKKIVERRARPLNEFRHKYLNLSKDAYYSFEDLLQNVPYADCYCVGSDQVWNSDWNQGFEKAFYLEFAPEGARRIAYASSIGKDKLDAWEVELMKNSLSKFHMISVREKSAARLLSSIGFEDASHLVDPTLMLDSDAWRRISSGGCFSGPYILVYQLNSNRHFCKYAKDFAKKKGLPLVRIAYGVHEINRGGTVLICPSVEDFISLFENAEYVLTDSFHGTAFSVNFSKKFACVSPSRFGGRIAEFLADINAESHLLTCFDDYSIADIPIDYDKVHLWLDSRREEAKNYLLEAIN